MRRFFRKKNFLSFVKDFVFLPGVVFVAVTALTTFLEWVWLNGFLRSNLVLISLIVISITFATWKNWPKSEFEYKLGNKDVRIKLAVTDFFKQSGAFIIPVNDEFDMCLGGTTLKSNSLKSQAIFKFFGGSCKELVADINLKLKKSMYKPLRVGGKYKMGTTVCVEKDKKRFYFVVNSVKNINERVEAKKEDLDSVLAELWTFLGEHAFKEGFVIPLLGTGNGRIPVQRQEVFKEIVRSFIVSCSEKIFCDKLTIVVKLEDVDSYELDVDGMNDFLRSQCKYQ